MMKSEYDRSYIWNPPGGNYYSQHLKGKKNVSEPLMTHKRRVKLTEDNVIIGEPLPSQNDDNLKEDPYFVLGDKTKKFHPSIPYRNIKVMEKSKMIEKSDKDQQIMNKSSEKRSKNKQRRTTNLINEAVQTENDFPGPPSKSKVKGDKSTQIAINVPESLERRSSNVHSDKAAAKESGKLFRPGERSEYQSKYAWVDPIERQSSAFEKGAENKSKMDTKLKIYNSFMSEYQRQFRPYEFVSENRFKRMKPSLHRSYEDSHIQVVPAERLELPPRRALTPPPPPVRHRHRSPPPQHTLNPHRHRFPHGRQKRFLTEYSANFDNKWQRLEAEVEKNLEQEAARQSMQQSKWYKEILELRKKAHEYRQRARGTHFSREHLGEVFTKSRRPDADDDDDYNDYNDRRVVASSPMNKTGDKARLSRLSRDDDRDRPRSGHKHLRRPSSVQESIVTPHSQYSSDDSTVVDDRTHHNTNHRAHTAGKPSFDNSLLLDEQASHDTELKDDLQLPLTQSRRQRPIDPVQPMAGTYTLQRYFNDRIDGDGDGRLMQTIDYDTIGRQQHRSSGANAPSSIISTTSSCHTAASTATSRSLALDTLDRAKRHRDEILRSKS